MVLCSEVMSYCVIESSDAGDVAESILIIIWSFVLRSCRLCMVVSSDAGDVAESFFILIWSYVLR